jgi:hypothetical protein
MNEIYNSDNNDSFVIILFSSIIPESSPANDLAFENYKGQQFIIVDHTVNIRNGSKISKIWRHGFERRRADDGFFNKYWRCGHYQYKKILKCVKKENKTINYFIRYF